MSNSLLVKKLKRHRSWLFACAPLLSAGAAPAQAGCLCNLVAQYVDVTGTLTCAMLIVSTTLMFCLERQGRPIKTIALALATFVITYVIARALDLGVIAHTPGTLANTDLQAHWVVLLAIVFVFTAAIFYSGNLMVRTTQSQRTRLSRRLGCGKAHSQPTIKKSVSKRA